MLLLLRPYPLLLSDTRVKFLSASKSAHFHSTLFHKSLFTISTDSSSLFFNVHCDYPKSKYVYSISRFSASDSSGFTSISDESENDKILQVSKRLERTSIHFKKLSGLGIWCQFLSTAIAATVLSFSVVITGKIVSPIPFYATSFAIVAAFVSVFWAFGYIRIAENLWKAAKDPSQAQGREEVVKSLRNGIGMNVIGMGAAIAGMLVTTTGSLAKAIAATSNFNQQNHHSVTLDVFLLLQASTSTVVSHFLGLLLSLELLRYISPPPATHLDHAS